MLPPDDDNRPPPAPAFRDRPPPQENFTLLVAGCRGGKTSFLRLLLDTSSIAPTATPDQLASVAKFVQGCTSHTSAIRTTSIDINLDIDSTSSPRQITLHLVDTPSLDFARDQKTADWRLGEVLRHLDSRFVEGAETDWTPQKSDRFAHLCIYFLDPDQIVPPVPAPSAPPIASRARTNSFSHAEQEPVILEPPLTTNPLLLRPTLPVVEIDTIRRISSRCNVLPVVSRADILCNDRLNAVKLAVRRDLAEEGIGFGIFDMPMDHSYQPHPQDTDLPSTKNPPELSNGPGPYGGPPPSTNSASAASSNHPTPPTSPVTSIHLRLPYALISPDIYSHSEGVARTTPTRHELVQQYTPSPHYPAVSKFPRTKFLRSYRWGVLDVMEPTHCDFLSLRSAIFHHMETLQKYTRDYLFDKFRVEYLRQKRPSPRHHPIHHHPQLLPPHVGPLSHGSRPILAIDTAPHQPIHRHPPPPMSAASRDMLGGDHLRSATIRPMSDSIPSTGKQRSKKITVACNFCRSRKLKCDGGRPACGQCVKRSNPCDYMPQNKRRGTLKQRKDDESESDSGDDGSIEPDEHSVSPKVPSQPLSRRDGIAPAPVPLTGIPLPMDRRVEDLNSGLPLPGPVPSTSSTARPCSVKPPTHPGPLEPRSLFADNELPRIATLTLPEHSPSTPVPMSAPMLPAIRPASDQQAAQRKRAVTFPGKGARQTTNAGPKVVACNFCRARKTKCDGAHPACASCARRSLPCNYVHESGSGQGQKKGRRGSSSTKPPTAEDSPHSPPSPPSSRMVQTPSTSGSGVPPYDHPRESEHHIQGEIDLKRNMDYGDIHRPPKKMRLESSVIP